MNYNKIFKKILIILLITVRSAAAKLLRGDKTEIVGVIAGR